MVVRKRHRDPTRVCQENRWARAGGLHPPPHRHRGQREGGRVSLTSLIAMERDTFLPRALAAPVNHEQVTTGTPRCTDRSPEECGRKTRIFKSRRDIYPQTAVFNVT